MFLATMGMELGYLDAIGHAWEIHRFASVQKL